MELNVIQMTSKQFTDVLNEAAEAGAIKALKMAGVYKQTILSRNDLYRRYSKSAVDNVLNSGQLIPRHIKGRKRAGYLYEEVIKVFKAE